LEASAVGSHIQAPRSPWSSLSQDTSRATAPTSMRPSRCTTPCLRPAACHSSPGFPTRQSHQTPPNPSSLLSGCLGGSTPYQPAACSALLPTSPMPVHALFCDEMSSQPFPRLPTPMSRRHWFWRESTRGQGMVRRCSQIKCRVCVKAAHPLLPRPIKAAWVGGRYPEAHNLSAAHFAARPLGMLRPGESRRRFWPWLCPYIQKQCCQPVFLCTASRPGT
jgi:hypothetical protein